MGSLKLTLRLSTCSSLLLCSAAPLLLPLRLRPSQRPRLMLTTHMPMVLTHMLMVPMLMELTHTPMVTTERDPLRLNQRLMLMLTTDTEPTDMDTHTDTTERDLLMLSQRLRLMLTTDTHTDTEHTDMDTHTDTTERDLLMLSQRPRLMLLSCTEPTDMVPTHMPTDTTERDLLMPSQRLMLTTVMVMDTHMPMVLTDHTLMVPTEESGDKHLKSSVQIRSSKQTSITNDA